MNTITTTISEVKKSMPRHVLWLVMFAAFLVVVILFVLLITKKSPEAPAAPAAGLAITINPADIMWTGIPVGEKRVQTIKITTSDFAIIPSVKLSEKVAGLGITTTCVNMGEIAPEIPCSADLTWKPETALARTNVKILIEYYSADAPEGMAKTVEIPVALSARKAIEKTETAPQKKEDASAPVKEEPFFANPPVPSSDDIWAPAFAEAGVGKMGAEPEFVFGQAYEFEPQKKEEAPAPIKEEFEFDFWPTFEPRPAFAETVAALPEPAFAETSFFDEYTGDEFADESSFAEATGDRPEFDFDYDFDFEQDFEPEPEFNPVIDAVKTLSPPIASAPAAMPLPNPAASAPAPAAAPKSEDCYEFAFGGYDAYGKQIGWIRPAGGRYLFHPFSDKDCSKPTGEYDPDTGFITDLKNPGRKIGSDSERIRLIASVTTVPALSNPSQPRQDNRARQSAVPVDAAGGSRQVFSTPPPDRIMTSSGDSVVSSKPYDRSFILRQYKPIPATIVNEVRADPKTLHDRGLPVTATVDRHVYSDNGRTIIIPTGTMMLGYVTGEVPGPYKAIGRMQIEWYQFIRPDGVEFNFAGSNPFSGDSQGRVGVPGHGSTDYMEQFIMPMITAAVPAAVNLIAPISDRFVNQIDLDRNVVTQSGQVRSSELAKNEIISTWNKVAQKLMVDMLDNTVPPFTIAAGTRINVFSPVDLQVTCGLDNSDKKCAISEFGTNPRANWGHKPTFDMTDASWVGQVRSFDIQQYCGPNGTVTASAQQIADAGFDYRTVVFWCQASQYQAINNARQQAMFDNQQQMGYAAQNMGQVAATTATGNANAQQYFQGTQAYNEQVLGLKYEDGAIKNPFVKEVPPPQAALPGLMCEDGTPPDFNGCCTGEIYTDMGAQGFNCCPSIGGDCFPPLL
ncbi:MAG: hypothetical protein FWF97_00820 [Alphaproteobacteria bacterium]|nr:hypothetical protein [Alphaproteobacteria bacterium]